ncbi:putative type I restriction enzymeP M protein [Stieleria neptunia]|uniref:site-specific DNA-methyltransferase (adenine-specific) n=2 Tax=Stieleria neptunia TaxID=2527979 RepID=A0A518HNS9_9BACT|nr:putative type I restriction enzymeP M protein [Stieleria neptunia]
MAKKKAAKANGKANGNGKALAGQQSVNSVVKSICDIMRRGGCEGAMDYVPELTWMLFLRILDEREQREEEAAEVVGAEFSESIESPYRWRDWAAPDGPKRIELTSEGSKMGDLFAFVSEKLLPYLHKLGDQAHSTARQKVIAEIMLGVDRTKIDTEKNLQDVLDKIHDLSSENIDDTHVFTLSQVYEGLLLKMGERNNDGGQFFTPREIIRAIVQVVQPKIGETIYDPCCGTGGFLAQSFEFLAGKDNELISTSDDLDTLRLDTFFGREKGAKAYSIALANLMLHGIDRPNLWHGNTLTKQVMYDGKRPRKPFLARGVGWWVFTHVTRRFPWFACQTPPFANVGRG